MNTRKSIFRHPALMLPLIIVIIGASTAIVAIMTLFSAAINEDKYMLREIVRTQARLMESVAAFDAVTHNHENPQDAFNDTMVQVVAAHKSLQGFGKTGEFVIGRMVDGEIAILQKPRFEGDINFQVPEFVPIPMFRALVHGETGDIIAQDYWGNEVLAAYEPVSVLNIGLVAKIDTDEVYGPFIFSASVVSVLTFVMLVLGVFASRKLSAPFKLLEASEVRFNQSQGFANIGTWDWNIKTGDLYWSERIGPLFGYPKGDLETSYDNFMATIHPDDRQAVADAVNGCVENGDIYSIEHRTVWPDGTVRWLYESGDVVRDDDGSPINMLGVVQDITERKRAEQELQENKNTLTRAQEISKTGSWKLNPNTGEVEGSEELKKIFGLENEELALDSFVDVVHPDDREYDLKYIQNGIENGVPWDIEHRLLLKDGSVKWIQATGKPQLDEAGKTESVIGIVRDITERKRAEQELQEANNFLNTVFQESPIGIAIYDEGGQCIDANQMLANNAGTSIEQVKTQNFRDLESWAKSGLTDAAIATLETGKPSTVNTEVKTTFGRSAKLDCYFAPLESGGKRHLLMMIADQTAVKEAETHARRTQERLMVAIESMDDGFVLFDADDQLVLCNNRFKHMYRQIANILTPGTRFENIVRALVANNAISIPEGDEEAWIEERMRVHRDGDGVTEQQLNDGRWIRTTEYQTNDGGIVGLRSDITHLKNYESAISQFKQSLDQTLDGVFMFDPQTMLFTFSNSAAMKQVGYDEGELMAMHPYDIKPEISEQDFRELTEKIIKTPPHIHTFETVHQHKDGHVLPVEVLLQYIKSDDGYPRFVAIVRDITERKELQSQLIQSSKMATLGEMATGVAHELNQPLNVIRMAAQNIQRKVEKENADPAYLIEKLGKISGQVVRAASIIDHMRIFGRKVGTNAVDLCPIKAVNSSMELIGEQLRLASIDITIDADDECRPILGHQVQMEQVLLNLLSNARDSVKANSKETMTIDVTVRDLIASNKIEISVTDNGNGIDAAVIDRIFEPFYTTKEIGKGTGLGLSISFGIISEMGGTIRAENTGSGARFTIELPVSSTAPEAKAGKPAIKAAS